MKRTLILVVVAVVIATPWMSNGRAFGMRSSNFSVRANLPSIATSLAALRNNLSNSGDQGAGSLIGSTSPGAAPVFTVNVPSDGQYGATLHYANADNRADTLDILVNGIPVKTAALPSTGGSTTFADRTEQLPLRAGINTVTYTVHTGSGSNVRVSQLTVSGATPLASTGATLPYVEQEAETAQYHGDLIGPSRKYGDVAAEASHRQAVVLRAQGDYVTFKLQTPANAMVLRYSIPDSADGTPYTAPLSLYVNGTKVQDLTLTNKYSWFYGTYPFTNIPSDGQGHHFFDEVHTQFDRTYPAGTSITVQKDAIDSAASYTIDLADFEQVPRPYAEPHSGYISVTDHQFGADPTGTANSTSAFRAAVTFAESHGLNVWVPAGRYTVTGHIVLNHVTIRGAGPWYTTLHGAGVGLYGDYAAEPDYPSNDDGNAGPSAHVGIYDLAIQGETTNRVDAAQVNGIGGSLGSGSIVQNVWIEHTKVGMWLDGPFSGLHIVGCRIHDVTADGINFHDGISYATVEETDIRNTGDDGLAMWSERHADYNDTFAFNSVRNPILANNFAIYGGHDNSVVGDYGADTLTQGGGIHVGNRFSSVLLSGTTTVSGNTLDRTGEQDPNWNYGVGAIWFYALDAPMKGTINVSNNTLNDSTDEAYQFTSDGNYAITNVTVTGDTVNKVGTFVVQIQTSGSATFRDVVAHDIGIAGVDDCYNTTGTHAFVLTADTGDDTWANSRGCYALGGLGTDVGTATPVAQPTWTPAPVPPAPQTVWLQNKGNGQYVTYDPTTNVARFTPTLDPNDLNEQWLVVSFNGKLHICSVTNKEPYGPGQDTACWSEQAWTDSVQPTPPGAPAPGSDGHLPYIRVGSTYDSWGSNQFSLIDQGDGYDQIKVTGWYNDLVDSSAGYGYADVTYTPSSPANAEWKVIPVGGTATPTSAPGP